MCKSTMYGQEQLVVHNDGTQPYAVHHFFLHQDRANPCGCSSVTGTTHAASWSSPAERVSTRSSTSIEGD